MKTAAIYTRVSSDQQKESKTIESQVEALLSFACEKGCVVGGEYIFKDEGYSGGNLLRPGLEKIRDLSAEGSIQAVLIYSPDRLSRNYAYQVLLLDEFASHGTEVLFVNSPKAETPEEALLLQFQGMIAEYERALIKERSRRGKRSKAKAGIINVLGGAPFGYEYIRKTPQSTASYEIIEEQAVIVREIFKLYTQEFLSLRAIAKELGNRQIKTRKGNVCWQATTIRNLLSNAAYMGKAYFSKTECSQRKRMTKGLRAKGGYSARNYCRKQRASEEWIEIGVPAIIGTEIFELARQRLKINKVQSARNTIETSLLQGLLVCSECGYSLHRVSSNSSKRKIYYYRCGGADSSRFGKAKKCRCRAVRQDYVDELVWQNILELLKDPRLIEAEINKRTEQAKNAHPAVNQKELLEKQKANLLQAVDKLLDAYQEGLVEMAELRKRMPDLQKRLGTTVKELENLQAYQLSLDNRLQLLNVNSFAEQLQKNSTLLDVKEKRKIIKLLVKEIVVGTDSIHIKHSIPLKEIENADKTKSYQLCTYHQ